MSVTCLLISGFQSSDPFSTYSASSNRLTDLCRRIFTVIKKFMPEFKPHHILVLSERDVMFSCCILASGFRKTYGLPGTGFGRSIWDDQLILLTRELFRKEDCTRLIQAEIFFCVVW